MIEIKAPGKLPDTNENRPMIFLAGSINMGQSADWRAKVRELFKDQDVILFNPLREEWDSTWVQSIDNPQFREQVEWELRAQEQANWIIMYFEPGSSSPISLLELGLFVDSGKMIVCCPEGFYRKGNVDIVCKRYGARQIQTLDELTDCV